MSRTAKSTGNQLTNALRGLDVNSILGGKSKYTARQTEQFWQKGQAYLSTL